MALGEGACVGGGSDNTAEGDFATIVGSASNVLEGDYASIIGGQNNKANASLATILGGLGNIAMGQAVTIGGGQSNIACEACAVSVIGGGLGNEVVDGEHAVIVGGQNNVAIGDHAVVGGGAVNSALDMCSVVSGGLTNTADGQYSTASGGQSNTATGAYSWAVGESSAATDANSAALGFSGNRCPSMGEGTVNICTKVGGLFSNGVALPLSKVHNSNEFVNDQDGNWVEYATILGGQFNTVFGEYSTVGGGYKNAVSGMYGTVTGGSMNNIVANYGTITGGFKNRVAARFATVLGGSHNSAFGRYSVAGGSKANAWDDNSMALGFSDDFCNAHGDNEISMCADSIQVNGNELLDFFYERRELEEAQTGVLEHEKLESSTTAKLDGHAARIAEHGKLMSELDVQLSEQMKLISALTTTLNSRRV